MIRVLICAGVLPSFFQAPEGERKNVFNMCKEVFGHLESRFGVKVLGSLDDDQVQIGPTLTYPWTFYILCDAPDFDSVAKVVNQLRQGQSPLYKYIKLETRIGRAASDLGLP